ncbi:RNA ligase family protein [Denitrificimonas caeni]|uniref:RNA ligase family protein n=1 Tax=Denitrificimonas caeni TaxID=521720 RepID=A0AAE9VU57_9GAMM|nr:RNA ligase family protein [Denitrificimonas caeni]NLJ12091.1 RNA ligase family protein [Gammaproteobacteria bacterium]WBE24886.1 RNA ligase family protein [Denitrificimonas caeni]
MSDFFRFPHTPHIDWLGDGMPRDDKVLTEPEIEALLAQPIRVEEKLDGANLGISLRATGELRAQNRGQYLLEPFAGQFSRLNSWLGQHQYALCDNLQSDWIVFGEWCAARHSLDYDNLPDWFVVFDVYDRTEQKFWSCARRNALAEKLGLAVVPTLYQGAATLPELKELLAHASSRYREGNPEGIVMRQDSELWCEARAKLVRADFAQSIEEHWRSRAIEWNDVRILTAEDFN